MKTMENYAIKKRLLIVIISLVLALPTGAYADSITGPLDADDMRGLNTDDDPLFVQYGPQTAIRAHNEEDDDLGLTPLTFMIDPDTGVANVPLFGVQDNEHHNLENVDALLFVLTMNADDIDGFGLAFFDASNFGGFTDTIVFFGTDFYPGGDTDTAGTTGFPTTPPGGSGIDGIGNSDLNGVKFPAGLHAGVLLEMDGLGSFTDYQEVGSVDVSTDVDLRVDIFGVDLVGDTFADGGGVIINNTPNSGAFGVTPYKPPPRKPDIPEPATVALIGLGLIGIAVRRKKVF